MKKRILALLLTLVTALSLCSAPAAAFSDVADRPTATAVETLRLMGVLDGYGDGTFRPNAELNRAQFCKMTAYLMDGSGELGKYSTVTVFPDVKPSHWASSYINMAAKGARVISGYPDGKFHPERTVTAGQAVTILLRLLGYSDADIGGIWPASQMAMGQSVGLTDGVGLSDGNRALTRAQAAKLFQNFLRTETKSGGTYYELSDETTLLTLDGGAGTMTVTGGKEPYSMVRPAASSDLVGSRGRVVLNGKGKALTFLPASGGNTGVADAAVIMQADRSAAGLDALTGGSSYTIYKNGVPATVNDLRKNDVATWNAASQTVRVCDTRLTAYYENCTPSPDAPATIQVLGTEFNVLSTARESLAKFKPGRVITLLLTADGQVAGAVEVNGAARSNAVAVVSESGKIRLLCGTMLVDLNVTANEEKFFNQAVRISSSKKDEVNLSVLQGGVSGSLDVTARTLGGKALAENATVVTDGEITGLGGLSGVIRENNILYARTNWAGKVDLIVLRGADTDVIYGRVIKSVKDTDAETGEVTYQIEVKYDTGSVGPYESGYGVSTGDFVAAKINSGKNGFSRMDKLTRLKNVSESAWVGKGAVNFGGKTYTVPTPVLCYNLDTQNWMTLDAALAYADAMDLYVDEGVVRIITVKS